MKERRKGCQIDLNVGIEIIKRIQDKGHGVCHPCPVAEAREDVELISCIMYLSLGTHKNVGKKM